MCLKIVIEDQVEDAKFTQEKFKKSTFLAYTSIEARNLLPPWKKLNTTSIHRVSQIGKNQQREKAYNLFIWNLNWNPFELLFKEHYKQSIIRLFKETNTPFIRLGFFITKFSLIHYTKDF